MLEKRKFIFFHNGEVEVCEVEAREVHEVRAAVEMTITRSWCPL
jgi:hypothetical protein